MHAVTSLEPRPNVKDQQVLYLCDGGRPVCGPCRRLGKTTCLYLPRLKPTIETLNALQQENEHLKESGAFLSLLAAKSEDDAVALLQRYRAGGDVPALLNEAKDSTHFDRRDGAVTGSTSEQQPAGSKTGAPPPAQSSFEFELMNRHPIAYPTLVPVDGAYLDINRLLNPDDVSWVNEELTSLADTNLADDVLDVSSVLSEEEQAIHERLSSRSTPIESTSPLAGQALCDDRLGRIDISRWTSVNITNEFAARVLSQYLVTDHPVLGLFDASLFLDNAVSGVENFCSGLLFSALLASACQSYSYLESEAASLSKLFYQEASRHWDDTVKSGHFTLTSVAASQLLSITALCDGDDASSVAFLKAGTQIGKQLGLFGVTESDSAKYWLDHHYDWVRAASHTAWGVFGWVTIRCLAFHAGQIECAPTLPIPGDGRHQSGLHAESDTVTARSSNLPRQDEEFHPLPAYMGNTFPALCKLWVIANDFIWHYYDHDDTVAPMKRAKLERARDTYQKLLHWADGLAIDMARGDDNKHHTVIAHVFYHAIILDIFRPFMLMKGPERDTHLSPFSSADATAASVSAASTKQLLRLTLLYRARFQQNYISFLWQTALLSVANVMLSPTGPSTDSAPKPKRSTPTANRRWLRLCLKGYETLYRSFPAVERTVLGLLSMAMRNRVITASEAREVIGNMRRTVEENPNRLHVARGGASGLGRGEIDIDAMEEANVADDETPGDEEAQEPRTGNTAMVDLDLAMTDPLASHIGILASQFHELALFEEFTTAYAEEEPESGESDSSGKMALDT